MISFNRRTKIFVSREPTDMRASYDTLFAKAKGVLNQDPFSGHLFLFINSRRTSIKCLYYDGTGLVIISLCRARHNAVYAARRTMPNRSVRGPWKHAADSASAVIDLTSFGIVRSVRAPPGRRAGGRLAGSGFVCRAGTA